MIRHSTKIRRHLRSARVAAMTSEERQDELRAAAQRIAQEGGRSEPAAPNDTLTMGPKPSPGAS
jgi:hypothetical protein